jgi:lipoate-protein ligase A
MVGTAKQKVPGGKLLTVKLKYDDRIRELQILGDFFVFPEDALPEIERILVGTSIKADADEISTKIRDAAKSKGIELVGITPDSIAQTVKAAVESKTEEGV